MGPATKMPSRTPNPQPMLMESISPFALLLRMDWATHPQPNISSTMVPSSSAQNSFAIFACSCFLKIFFPPAPIGTGFPPTGMITDMMFVRHWRNFSLCQVKFVFLNVSLNNIILNIHYLKYKSDLRIRSKLCRCQNADTMLTCLFKRYQCLCSDQNCILSSLIGLRLAHRLLFVMLHVEVACCKM